MLYIVERTSEWDDSVPPCNEAVLKDVECYDERMASVEVLKSMFPEEDFTGFVNISKNKCIKHFIKKRWTIEINTLEELTKFINKYGNIVISNNSYGSDMPCIEIYDCRYEC